MIVSRQAVSGSDTIENRDWSSNMASQRIAQAVAEGRVLVSDGAWGTFLQQKGLQPGECPEAWCVNRRDDVFDVARSYVEAGSDMIQAGSFGGTRFKLRHYGLEDKVSEFNEAAARISAEAINGGGWSIPSIGPTGVVLMMGEVSEEELYDGFKEQALALERGGADALCVETMSALDECELAIKACLENTSCEVICTLTFSKTVQGAYRTMMGVSPTQAAEALTAAGAHIIGTNCGNGIAGMIDIVKEMREVNGEIPILVHANAGMPRNVDGRDVFPETPEDMAGQVGALVEAGTNIVGGCCGTTPDHIRAMKKALASG